MTPATYTLKADRNMTKKDNHAHKRPDFGCLRAIFGMMKDKTRQCNSLPFRA